MYIGYIIYVIIICISITMQIAIIYFNMNKQERIQSGKIEVL